MSVHRIKLKSRYLNSLMVLDLKPSLNPVENCAWQTFILNLHFSRLLQVVWGFFQVFVWILFGWDLFSCVVFVDFLNLLFTVCVCHRMCV